jgi:hypothetical protein
MDFLFERLAWLAGQAPAHTPWRAAILDLCRPEARLGKSTLETGEMLVEAARMLRATHQIATEAYYYVVTWVVEYVAEAQVAQLYATEYAPKFQAIERDYHMRPNWEFREGQEPPEYVSLSSAFDRQMMTITADMLRHYKEPVLAELYERDQAEFLRLKQAGRIGLLGNGPQPASVLS